MIVTRQEWDLNPRIEGTPIRDFQTLDITTNRP